MHDTIFKDAANTYIGNTGRTVYAWIQVGTDKANRYLIIDNTEGVQLFRTQYDIAVDGTQYILTAGRGHGGFSFTVLEGPICNADDRETFASKYGDLDKYKTRTIKVVTSLDHGEQATASTKNAAKFSGVIVSAETRHVIGENGATIITTTINAEGMWG